VRALRQSVNTGVGSSGAMNADNFVTNALKSAFEMILHRVAMRLALPTSKRGAVISDNQF
jgi:hypothetical protein